ncbi:hypothetical protein H0H92_008938 [Tricholoma furcatifolium]|nr:hypothetical protein H0H92_008938 [Tricholoma furcatifolium]
MMFSIENKLPHEHQSFTTHPQFNSPEGNIVLISREGTLYHVPSYVLRTASQLFNDLLPKNETNTLYITLSDEDSILVRIVCMISGLETLPWNSFDELERTLLCAERLRMQGPISIIRTEVAASLALGTFEALQVFGLADRRSWKAEAKCASSKTLSICLFDEAYDEQLKAMDSASVVKLFRFHLRRRDKFREGLNSSRFAAGNTTTACSQCGAERTDNFAWSVFKERMVKEMESKPSGETLFTWDMEDWPEYDACWEARCSCGKTASSSAQVALQAKAIVMKSLHLLGFVTACLSIVACSTTTVAEIQGNSFKSPLNGQTVTNVPGIVTAKWSSGFWIVGEPSTDIRVSNGLNIYTTSSSTLSKVSVGDLLSLGGKVVEYRSSSYPNYLYATEIESPTNITILSNNNTVTPIVLGVDRSPPTQQLSALDVGPDGYLSVPNNVSLVEVVDAVLQPDLYGLDFWESLEGQLVTIPKPVAIGFPNSYGEFWVYGDWNVTGKNGRGGLSITIGPDGKPDANPEAVMIGRPLDGSKSPGVALGATLTDITGIVYYQYGYFYVLPITAPTVIGKPHGTAQPTAIQSHPKEDCTVTFGDYNVENLAPNSAHLPTIANHIATYLNTPDIVFVQEIQDNSGPIDDGTVDANVTLTNLVNAIASISNMTYDFLEIAPIDGTDGGQPGGNIRQAYLFNPEKLSLAPGAPAGTALDKVEVLVDKKGNPMLNFNPGRIDPTNAAWNSSRKPLVAEWQAPNGESLFTINVHLASKGGSSSNWGDARPPVNSPVNQRSNQIGLVAAFVQSILDVDAKANILLAGDFNEYTQTRKVFQPLTDVLTEADEAANVPSVERYTYIFDQNSEQLDHVFVSDAIKERGVKIEHIHVNNWAPTLAEQASDHDPSIGLIRICHVDQ